MFLICFFFLFVVSSSGAQEVLDSQCVLYRPALEVVCSHLNGSDVWPAAGSWAERRVLGAVRALKFEHLDVGGCGLHLEARLLEKALPRLKTLIFPPGCDGPSSCVSVVDSAMVPVDWRFLNNILCNFTITTAAPPTSQPSSAGMPTWASVLLTLGTIGATVALIFVGLWVRRKYCTEIGIDAAQHIPLRLFPNARGGSYQALGVMRM